MRFLFLISSFCLVTLVVSLPLTKEKRDNVVDSDDDLFSDYVDDFKINNKTSNILSVGSDIDDDIINNDIIDDDIIDIDIIDDDIIDIDIIDDDIIDDDIIDADIIDGDLDDIWNFDGKRNFGKKKSSQSSTSRSNNNKLVSQTYDQISISGGRAGNADKEAATIFRAIDSTNLAGVSDSDLTIIKNTQNIANLAEVEAFNPAIASATGMQAEALQNGKIKNKVLKNLAGVLALEIEQARGGENSSELEAEIMELNRNIQADKSNAGRPSLAVEYVASN